MERRPRKARLRPCCGYRSTALHRDLGARMAGFAGYDMPIQYPAGLKREHLPRAPAAACSTSRTWDSCWCGRATAASRRFSEELEACLPLDFDGWHAGVQKYSLLLNERGGIEDDLMLVNLGAEVRMVVNAGNRAARPAPADDALPRPGLRVDRRRADRPPGPAGGSRPGGRSIRARHRRASWRRSRWSCSARPASPRAPATPVRTVSRSRSRRSRPNWWCASCWTDPRVTADRPRRARHACGSKPDCRCTAADIGPDTTPVEAQLAFAIARSRRSDGPKVAGFPGAEVRAEPAGPRRIAQAGRAGTSSEQCRSARMRRSSTTATPGRRGHQRHDLPEPRAIR